MRQRPRGGAARREPRELVAPLAEATLEDSNLDLAVVGVDGTTLAGGLITCHDIEARTPRVLIGRVKRVIAVADGSKAGRPDPKGRARRPSAAEGLGGALQRDEAHAEPRLLHGDHGNRGVVVLLMR